MRMAAVGGPVTEHDRHGPHPQHHVSEIRVRATKRLTIRFLMDTASEGGAGRDQ
jgi:hypothetical protein